MAALRNRPARREWERVSARESTGFLELRGLVFEELDAEGRVIASANLERVVPRTRSRNTIAVAPLTAFSGEVWIGIDDDDLPAAQCFHGNSEILVAPAWRLPREVASLTPAREWVRERLQAEYGVVGGEIWELGGRYHPSPGVTPEVVHALAIEIVGRKTDGQRTLTWVTLRDAMANRADLRDGHLRTVVLRAAHALGLMGC
jgi:hypothetical protein